MANPHRGEYEFEANGKRYRLFFSADVICGIEAELNMGLGEIGDLMRSPDRIRMSVFRTMFNASLVTDDDESLRESLFKAILPMDAIAHVIRAFNMAFGVPNDGAAQSDQANPTQPGEMADGTGPASISTGSSSASTQTNSGKRHPEKSAAL